MSVSTSGSLQKPQAPQHAHAKPSAPAAASAVVAAAVVDSEADVVAATDADADAVAAAAALTCAAVNEVVTTASVAAVVVPEAALDADTVALREAAVVEAVDASTVIVVEEAAVADVVAMTPVVVAEVDVPDAICAAPAPALYSVTETVAPLRRVTAAAGDWVSDGVHRFLLSPRKFMQLHAPITPKEAGKRQSDGHVRVAMDCTAHSSSGAYSTPEKTSRV